MAPCEEHHADIPRLRASPTCKLIHAVLFLSSSYVCQRKPAVGILSSCHVWPSSSCA